MINSWILLFFIFLSSCTKSSVPQTCPFSWNLEKVGRLSNAGSGTDVTFLSKTEILVVNLPSQGRPSAPLEIYTLKNGYFEFDKEASRFLPVSYHPRNIIQQDLDNDGSEEIIISDHGDDIPPYAGGFPIILKKHKGFWREDLSSKSMGKGFTFNLAALPLGNGTSGLFLGNIGKYHPLFFKKNKNAWVDSSSLFPDELRYSLCYMTTLSEDFDGDGAIDLYLGGCDLSEERPEQAHDRILKMKNGKWVFTDLGSLPARTKNSSWATVSIKSFNLNNDSLPDLLIATHDYNFHNWQINALENKSGPGHFKFINVALPLIQEENTDGFIYGIEDFNIKNSKQALMIEVRSVVRDSFKKNPKFNNRFMVKDKEAFIDKSSCLPDILKNKKFTAKKFPHNNEKLLLIPYNNEFYTLTVSDLTKKSNLFFWLGGPDR